VRDRYDVIVYGLVCLDTIWRVERLPQPGGYAPVLAERRTIGGEAANTAIALARWGVRVALVGYALGDDEDGRLLRDLFARDAPQIDTRFLAAAPDAQTPAFHCIATADGHRTIFGRCFTPLQAPPLDPKLARSARIFTLDPYGREAGVRACTMAAEAGLEIIAMDCTGRPEVSARSSIVVTSVETIGPEKPLEELTAFAAAVRDEYGPTTIVTRGEQGCTVAPAGAARGEVISIPAYTAPAVVDSTGAGDVFRAGLIYGRLQGWDLEATIRFASAAAALNCAEMGGWCGVRSVEEIREFQRRAASCSWYKRPERRLK
jgi:sugar/nucleoside kinase (ribokinase family)